MTISNVNTELTHFDQFHIASNYNIQLLLALVRTERFSMNSNIISCIRTVQTSKSFCTVHVYTEDILSQLSLEARILAATWRKKLVSDLEPQRFELLGRPPS